MAYITCRMIEAAYFLLVFYVVESLASSLNGTMSHVNTPVVVKANATENTSSKHIIPGNASINITGGPDKSSGLPGDTLDMPYTQRLMIALGILTVAMIVSLFVCYRKECNVMYWRYKKKSPRVKYEPLKVKMQVPPDV